MTKETRDGLKLVGRLTLVVIFGILLRPWVAVRWIRFLRRLRRGVATQEDLERCLG